MPRRTDEPGKGMKWQIHPDHRQEYWKRQARKGNQSSAPSSPAGKEPPAPRGVNGQAGPSRNLEATFDAGKTPTKAASPGFSSFSVAPVEAYTPERGSRGGRRVNDIANNNADYEEPSPLPSRSRSNTVGRTYGMSDNVAGSPPVLSSSFYEDNPTSSMITPAPRRQQPRLAPPSTAQIPSKFMPMSSPAQFWKFADIGSTPAHPVPDMSPLKSEAIGDDGDVIPSSSPPPPNMMSPSRPSALAGASRLGVSVKRERPDEGAEGEEGGGTVNGVDGGAGMRGPHPPGGEENKDDDEDGGGFDLARYVPIPCSAEDAPQLHPAFQL